MLIEFLCFGCCWYFNKPIRIETCVYFLIALPGANESPCSTRINLHWGTMFVSYVDYIVASSMLNDECLYSEQGIICLGVYWADIWCRVFLLMALAVDKPFWSLCLLSAVQWSRWSLLMRALANIAHSASFFVYIMRVIIPTLDKTRTIPSLPLNHCGGLKLSVDIVAFNTFCDAESKTRWGNEAHYRHSDL